MEEGVWQSSGLRDGRVFDEEDLASAWLRFDNGLVMTFETAWTTNLARDRVYSNLLQTKVGAAIDSYPPIPKRKSAAAMETVEMFIEEAMVADLALPYHANASHTEAIRHFLAVVEGRETPIITRWHGVAMQAILDGIDASADSGENVASRQ